MKRIDRILQLSLIVLVLLSLVLTYAIWLSPAAANNAAEENSSQQNVADETSFKKQTDVFLPIRSIWIADEAIYQSSSENVISSLQGAVQEARLGKLSLAADGEEAFNQYLTPKNAIEFLYEGQFLLSEYLDIFDLSLNARDFDDGDSIYFSKIQIDFDANKIRFLNFNKHQVYEAAISTKKTRFANIYQENKNRFIEMQTNEQISGKYYQTKAAVKLKKYSYILSSQPYALFRNAFFAEPTKARSEDYNTAGVQYYVSGQEELRLNENDRSILFTGKIDKDEDALSDAYDKSFYYVSRLGTDVGNLRYFDRDKDTVNYRIFVEGYPVFSTGSRGLMAVSGTAMEVESSGENSGIKIDTSMDTIQVPIPSDEEVELASSQEMLQSLQSAGADLTDIKSYIIGYTWQDLKETDNRVVDLTPDWYVQYQDTWYSYKSLLQKLG